VVERIDPVGCANVGPVSELTPTQTLVRPRHRPGARPQHAWPVLIVRFGVLAICGVLSLAKGTEEVGRYFVLLTAIAGLASLRPPRNSPAWLHGAVRLTPYLEAVFAALLIGAAGEVGIPLLPYLVVPTFVAGINAGLVGAGIASVATTGGLLLGQSIAQRGLTRLDWSMFVEWVGLGLATGVIGAWIRSIARRRASEDVSYEAAHALLTRLREIAGALPTGLDEVSLAQQVLSDVGEVTPFDRAALFVPVDSGTLVPLAVHGVDNADWRVDQDDGLWSRVRRHGRAEQRSGTFTDPSIGQSAAIPILLGQHRTAVIGIERDGAPWPPHDLIEAQDTAEEAALRLDTAALFSELRSLATAEERRRVAREIHDGIAQDIASVGYLVDDLAARVTEPQAVKELNDLRDRLTTIVNELRLSIFDLRSDVSPSAGLGAALAAYVRSVGAEANLTVHLVLDESAHRLAIDVETELLRIAQEAVTNARKHARARNLWVTVRIDPPRAFLRVADDGTGMGTPRPDSYGMEIMAERANRLGALLSVRNRVGGGTVVEILLTMARKRGVPAP